MEEYSKLEEALHERTIQNRAFILNDDQKKVIKKAPFDYELFMYDFDKTCRYLDVLSRLEWTNFSYTQTKLLKYVFILSTFLKNRTSTKITREHEIFLERTRKTLGSILSASLFSVPDNSEARYYDSCKIFASYALVNIYECVGITKTAPIHREAREFLASEKKLITAESSLITYVVWNCSEDFKFLGNALDETVLSVAFKKYNTFPRLEYSDSFEKQMLFVFYMYSAAGLVVFCVFIEYAVRIILK